jgi:uncharacterized repeat protein (TIGR01451 family)/fimbrial isopeptide formation D2 family protein
VLLAPVAALAVLAGGLYAAPALAAGTGVVSVTETFVNTTTGAPITQVDPLVSGQYRIDVSFSCSVANCDNTTVTMAPNVKDPYYNQFILESAGYSFTPPFAGATSSGSPAAGITVNLGNLTAGQNGVFQLYYTVQNRPGLPTPGSPGAFFPNGFVIPSQATIASSTAVAPVTTTASATWVSRTGAPTFYSSGPTSTRTDTAVTFTIGAYAACNYVSTYNLSSEVYQCAKSYTLSTQLPADAQYVAGSASSGGVYDSATRTVTWSAADTTSATANARGPVGRSFQVTFPSSSLPTTGAGCVASESFTSNFHLVLLDGTVQDPAASIATVQAQNCAPFSGMTTPTKTSSLNAGSSSAPIVFIPNTGQAANSRNWTLTVGNTANVAGVATITDTQLDQPDMPVYQIYNPGTATMTVAYTLKDSGGATTTGTATLAAGQSFVAPTGKRVVSVTATSAPLAGPNPSPASQTAHTDASISFYYSVSAGASATSHTNSASFTMDYPGNSLTQLSGTASRTVTLQATPTTPPSVNVSSAGPTVTGGGNIVTGSTVSWGVGGSVTNAPNNTSIVPQYVFIAPYGWNVTGTSWSSTPPVGTTVVQRQVTISGKLVNIVVATWPSALSIPLSGSSGALPTLFVTTTPTSAAPAGANTATMLFGDANQGTSSYSPASYTETTDLAGDGNTDDKYAKTALNATVLGTPSLNVLKEICRPDSLGNCTWIANSNATVGVPPSASSIKYRITITNTGQAAANNVIAYDVLPFIGDTGTSDATASTARGSTVRETLNSVSGVPSDLTLAYSTSSNPPRPGVYSGSTSGAWTDPAAGSSSLRATIATLAAGASRSFTYDAGLVGGSADQTACNSVAVIATSLTAVEPAAVCATTQQADLSETTGSRFPLQVGRVGTVPFVVNNGGGSQLATGTVALSVPSGLTIASLSIPNWTCTAPSMTGPVTVTCNPVDGSGNTRQLLLNTPETIPLQVTPSAAAVWSVPCIAASVTGIMNDPDLTNNSTSACSTVVAATSLLSVTKTDGVTNASPGQTLTYTITAANGIIDQGLTGVAVTDHLPANVQWVSGGTVSGQDANGLGGSVTFSPTNLNAAGTATATGDGTTNAGSSATFTVTVRVATTASGTVVNTTSAAATDPLTTSALTASAGDTDQLQRLTVTKSTNAPAAGVRTGDTVTYTVRLTNDGTTAYTAGNPAKVLDDASGVLDDANYVSGTVSVDGGASSAITPNGSNHIVWSGALPVGSVATIVYSVAIGSGGDKLLTNTAYASGQVGTSCTSGLDQNGISCATVQSVFAPLVDKQVQSLTQNNDGTWTIVYAVTVTNPSPAASSAYSLTDSLKFGTGIQVLSATVAIPSGATAASPAWSGNGAVGTAASISAGAQQVYILTVVADAHTVAGTAPATCVTHASGGFANQTTLSVSGVPDVSAEACASPVAPTIQKTVAPAVQQSNGSWNVVYTVTVGNSNSAPADLAYTVKDALGFPTGTTINSVTVAGANASGTFNGTSNQALLSGVGRIPASSTRVYTVTVNVSAPVGSVAPADLLCTPTGGGYANIATLFAGSGSTSLGTASACSPVAVAPLPTITKKVVSSSVGTDGNWTLVYQIDVQNTDASYATSYTLNDALDFATGVTVVSADVTAAPAGVTTNSAWDGAGTTQIVQNQTLAAGQTDQYQLTVVADPGTLDSTSAAADCRLDSGETGTGFLNVATVAAGVKSAVAEACEPATDPSVVKTVAQQPTQNTSTGVWTVTYQIAVTNKSTTTTGTIPYTVDDTINFPADVQNVHVSAAAGSGGSAPQSNFDGDAHPVLVHGAIGAAADASTPAVQLYTVTVTFTVPAGITSGVQCVAGQGPGGLQNVGEVTVGSRTSGSVACVDLPDVPTPALSKTVTSQKQLADGTWAVNYLITVANPSATSASRYSVDDQLALGTGMTVDSATVTNAPAGVSTVSGWDGQASTDLVNNILLPAGGSHTYTVRAVIDTGSVKGTSAAGDCTRGGGLGNGATLDTGIDTRQGSACVNTFDPGVTKTLDGAPVLQADGSWLLSYTMSVSNPSGVQLSYGLDDTLDFPNGTTTTVVSATGPGARNDWDGGSQSTLVDAGQPLAANAVDQFHVTVRATLPAGQASAANGWKNTATVASGRGGVITSDATAFADVALPHLEISKAVTANPVIHIGDQIDYTVTVTNSGDGDFTGLYPAVVWDDLSSVLDDSTLDAAPVATPNVGLVSTSTTGFSWRGALTHGDSVSLQYSVTTKSGGNADLLNIAFAAAPDATAPSTPALSSCAAPDCASTDTAMPALFVQKNANELTTTPGGTVHYTVTVTNTGSADIPGTDPATVTDDLSAVLAHASYSGDATVDRGAVTVSGQTLTWTGGLKAGDTATITYSVVVDPGTALGTSLVNVAISDPTLATLSLGGSTAASQVSVTTMVALLASTGAEAALAIAIAASLLAGGIFALFFSFWQRRAARRRRLVEG